MTKIGPRSVNPSSRGSSPSGVVAGGPGKSPVAKPFAAPAGKGQPSAMRKALAKKSSRGGAATGFAGLVR